MPLVHSYSAVKDFENCPRKYHETRILKSFKQSETQAMLYGTAVHKAFEEFVLNKTPLPEQFSQFQRFVEPLAALKGDIRCEVKMGIRADFTPCGFFDKDVWFRGIPDYVALDFEKGVARLADYKTGKSSRYADTAQLELMSAMIMAHHPQINKVKGALLFVVANDVVKAEHTRDNLAQIFSRWVGKVAPIEAAIESGVWNPRNGPLCGFCPVRTCEYHKG